jgi:hypothetical protein
MSFVLHHNQIQIGYLNLARHANPSLSYPGFTMQVESVHIHISVVRIFATQTDLYADAVDLIIEGRQEYSNNSILLGGQCSGDLCQ